MRYNDVVSYLQNLINGEVTQADIAKSCGLTRSTVNYRKMNNANFSINEVEQMKEYFQKEIQNWQNVYEKSTSSNITLDFIQASCGNGITIDTSLISNYDAKNNYSVAVAKGNSMSPTIENNDICIIKKYTGELIDGIYLFSIADDMYIKRLSNNINQLVCTSDNKDFDKIVLQGDELQKVNIVGQVVGLIRKF